MLATTLVGGVALVVVAGCGQEVRSSSDDVIAGKQLFVQKCGSCHTLSRAGTKGVQGPNLDDAFRQALADGFKRTTLRGIIEHQILYPARKTFAAAMPAKLVQGQQASDVAAYVATVAAAPGQDSGLLASAVKKPGQGKPAVEKGGVLQINADPAGNLAYESPKATGTAGPATFRMDNLGSAPHNIALQDASGKILGAGKIVPPKGTSTFQVTLKPGTYTYFCEVPGHRQAGMLGKLVVK